MSGWLVIGGDGTPLSSAEFTEEDADRIIYAVNRIGAYEDQYPLLKLLVVGHAPQEPRYLRICPNDSAEMTVRPDGCRECPKCHYHIEGAAHAGTEP